MAERPVVVFVDDDETFLAGLRRNLRAREGEWDVQFFASGKEALAAVADVESAVVVSDWMMQGVDGVGVVRQVRDAERREPDLARYVIVLTGRQGAEDAIAMLGKGADDFLSKPCDLRLLEARIRVGLRVLEAHRATRMSNRALMAAATSDPLTGLSNRRHLDEYLQRELQRVQAGHQNLCVGLAQLEQLHEVHGQHGRAGVDEALRAAARALRERARPFDEVARWGEDSFLLACPQLEATGMLLLCAGIREHLARAPVGTPPAALRCTFGIAVAARGCRVSPASLLSCADRALAAQRGGEASPEQAEHGFVSAPDEQDEKEER